MVGGPQSANQAVKTFTIGTKEASHDESSDAKAIAAHLGTEHHELIATAQDAIDVVSQLPKFYDEPFADSSQIPKVAGPNLGEMFVSPVNH